MEKVGKGEAFVLQVVAVVVVVVVGWWRKERKGGRCRQLTVRGRNGGCCRLNHGVNSWGWSSRGTCSSSIV